MRRAAPIAVLLAALVAGCDFTPALDIDTPEHVPALVLRSVLVADSVALVRLGESWDPYEGGPSGYGLEETPSAVVTLLRGGQVVERLALRSTPCSRPPAPGTTGPSTYECGPYVGTVPIEAGATYTVRAEAEGLPPAEGTVTVPDRPEIVVTEGAGDQPRTFRIRLADRAGQSDRYGIALLYSRPTIRTRICDERGCRDTTFANPYPGRSPVPFDTSDPLLLASARQVEGGVDFVTFPDETFEGQERTFTVSPEAVPDGGGDGAAFTVQVAALAGDVYDLYQVATFSGGDDNPFTEPVNLPSNVEGGYGIVGAVALAEVYFAPSGGAPARGRIASL